MTKNRRLTAETAWEMTAVPGELIECTGSRALLESRPLPLLSGVSKQAVVLTAKPLSPKYAIPIKKFKSAYPPLAYFLHEEAFAHDEMGNTCTTLFFDKSNDQLAAFCSTKCSSLKIKGNDILTLCPSIEIAVLCVDDRYRYFGVGHAVFEHLLRKIAKIRQWVGVQLITLFAIPDAVNFYQQLNFRRLSEEMKILYATAHKGCIPMYFPLPGIIADKR